MNQKVKFFKGKTSYELELEINKFAKTHHIVNISYSVSNVGYSSEHFCCVIYTD